MATKSVVVDAGGLPVTISNPDKVFFPERGYTKLELVNYFLAVVDGALRGVSQRPMVLKRFVNGATAEPFFQKRAPDKRPRTSRQRTSPSRAGARPTSPCSTSRRI